MSVRELKTELDTFGVDYRGVTDKSELVALVEEARSAAKERAASAGATSPGPSPSAASSWPAAAAEGPSRPRGASSSDPVALELRRIMACRSTDYYVILAVSRDADEAALKRAYRKLALQLHPDKCSLRGADEAFKRVSAAFAILQDPSQRRRYDFMGPASAGGGTSGGDGGGGIHYRGSAFGDHDAEELFRAFFGAGSTNVGAHFGGADTARSGSTNVDLHPGGLVVRLFNAFRANPWTLVTLLSGLASVVNIAESLQGRFGATACVALPAGAAAAQERLRDRNV